MSLADLLLSDDLPTIVSMPMLRPRFENARIRDFGEWFGDNQAALGQWYELTAPWAEDGDDFFSFCADQHDLELMR